MVDVKTHFKKRFSYFVASLLDDESNARDVKIKAGKITADIFSGRWEGIPESLASIICKVLPKEIDKSVYYDLKANPSKYLNSTLKMCQMAGKQFKMAFMPTRRSNIPCHMKLDTEVIAQLFISSKEKMEAKKNKINPEAASMTGCGVKW